MRKSKGLRLAAIGLSIFAAAMILENTKILSYLEYKSYDSRIKTASRFSRPSESIVLVVLDQDSLDWAKKTKNWSWPWPRSAYGDIVRYFSLAGASSLAFDVLYSEPSIYGAKDDAAFASANIEYGRTINVIHFFGSSQNEKSLFSAYAKLPPIDEIALSSALLANITSSADKDGIIRRARPYFEYEGKSYPALGLSPLLLDGKKQDIPLLKDGSMYLRYRKSIDEFIPYNVRQILQSFDAVKKGDEPLLPPELFKNSYVFFGFYAPGLFDIASTPVSNVYPGVGIHITMLDTILSGNFIQDTPAWADTLFILLMSFLGALIIFFREQLQSHKAGIILSLIAAPAVFIAALLAVYALFIQGLYAPLALPLISYSASFAISVFLSYNIEGVQRRYLKNAFRHYLSPIVIDELIAHPERLKLGGERKEISMYFSDLQGFTGISEKLEPEALTALLNDYLSEMSAIILNSGGTIDKYEGDAIIAFWNAPLQVENHSRAALDAAMQCQERLAELRDEYKKRTGMPLYMRIGLNTGYAVVGNMGSHKRFDYTMLGDSVNLAARLEGLNKQFGTYTMCTEAARNAALAGGSCLQFRELGKVAVVGKTEAVRIFEPIRKEHAIERSALLKTFEQGLAFFYEGKFARAQKIFNLTSSEDASAFYYAEKCKMLARRPIENWDGVWRSTEK